MTRLLVVLLLLAGCPPSPPAPDPGCDGALFGLPVANTGLDSSQCRPTCPCTGISSPDFTTERLDALRAWTLSTPFDELTSDPYKDPVPESHAAVCGVVVEDLAARRYHLQTFDDVAQVADAGAYLTHHDACGRCSTLVDFALYASDRDLGARVKKCGLDNLGQPIATLTTCLENLGFTKPCAQIWAFNTNNTRAECLGVCLSSSTYHHANGALSDCLACDETKSGPVFKAVAGRTRRNTGLATAICRPCSEVRPVAHDYP